jgi:hypothetical protein
MYWLRANWMLSHGLLSGACHKTAVLSNCLEGGEALYRLATDPNQLY